MLINSITIDIISSLPLKMTYTVDECYNIIRNNEINNFKHILSQMEKDDFFPDKFIARLFGHTIYCNSFVITSLLRLFVSDHKIKLNKETILEQIYVAECGKIAGEAYKRHTMISFRDFDERLLEKYSEKYGNLIGLK